MTHTQETAGSVFGRFWKAIMSVLTTGSIHAEEAADSLRESDIVLHQINEEIDRKAEKTLAAAAEAITQFNTMKLKAGRQQQVVDAWANKAANAVANLKSMSAENPDRAKMEAVAKKFLAEKNSATMVLKPMADALAEAEPLYEQAIQAVEQAGFNREAAESQKDILHVTAATADAKKKLAAAYDAGADSNLSDLFKEAQDMVDQATAEAKTAEDMAAAQPMTEDQADYLLGKAQRDDAVNADFAKLMDEGSEVKA